MKVDSWIVEAHICTIIDDEINFLLLKRSENEIFPNIWQMVTGSIDGDEKAYETALREVEEETGLVPKEFYIVPRVNSFYSSRWDKICMIPVFVGIVTNMDVKISAEHSEYKWVGFEEAKKMVAWDGQRSSIDLIYEYFYRKNNILQFTRIK